MKKLKLPSRHPATRQPVAESQSAEATSSAPESTSAATTETTMGPATTTSHEPAATKSSAKLISAWRLARAALSGYRYNLRGYFEIVAIVAIPANLLSLISLTNTDQLSSSYVSFAAIVMNVALIWAMVQFQRTGRLPGVRSAYYDGSVALVRFIIVSFLLVFMLVPAAFAAAFMVLSLQTSDLVGVSGPEQILIAMICILISLPSIFLITRFALSPFIAVQEDVAPVMALRRSWRLTRGYFWATLGRLLLLGLFLIIISLPTTLLCFGLYFINHTNLPQVLFSILTTLVALPVGNLFLLHLYRHLGDRYQNPPETPELPTEGPLELTPPEPKAEQSAGVTEPLSSPEAEQSASDPTQRSEGGVEAADDSTIVSEPAYNEGVGTKPPEDVKPQFGSSDAPTPGPTAK